MTSYGMSAEERLARLDLRLPEVPAPFGAYLPAVQTGTLLFLSGMLATAGHAAVVQGIIGDDLDVSAGRKAAHIAALNVLAVARHTLGSLSRVSRVVRLGVYVAATPLFKDHANVADAASQLLRDVLGDEMLASRAVFGVASLPFGSPVELEVILEVRP